MTTTPGLPPQPEELLAIEATGPEVPVDVVSRTAPAVDGIQRGTAGNIERAVEISPSHHEGRDRRFLQKTVQDNLEALDALIGMLSKQYDALEKEKASLPSYPVNWRHDYHLYAKQKTVWEALPVYKLRIYEAVLKRTVYKFLCDHVFSVPRDEKELFAGVPPATQELFQKIKAAIATAVQYLQDSNNFNCCLRDTFDGSQARYAAEDALSTEKAGHFDIMRQILHSYKRFDDLKKLFQDHPKLHAAIVVEMLDRLLPLVDEKGAPNAKGPNTHDLQTIVDVSGFRMPENTQEFSRLLYDFYYAN